MEKTAAIAILGDLSPLCARRLDCLCPNRFLLLQNRAALSVPTLRGLILLAPNPLGESVAKKLMPEGILIYNKDVLSEITFPLRQDICPVSCGTSADCQVTISGIQTEEGLQRIQCCIQTDIYTHQGRRLEMQEFAMRAPAAEPIATILAAVTASLLC